MSSAIQIQQLTDRIFHIENLVNRLTSPMSSAAQIQQLTDRISHLENLVSRLTNLDRGFHNNTPTIAVWSNNGATVPYMKNNNPYPIVYDSEQVIIPVNGLRSIVYHTGCHNNVLQNLDNLSRTREKGIFIQKQKNYWVKIGTIHHIEMDTADKVRIFLNDELPCRLATNKPDSLRLLGYTKKTGKGTGTYMMGVCRIQPIN
tara:strand:- start:687 stop:1292 length:606 start_codon:yes stop_codon:yes gene_type:complete